MTSDPLRGDHVSLSARARASAFTTIMFVIGAVGVALVLVATTSDSNLPATATAADPVEVQQPADAGTADPSESVEPQPAADAAPETSSPAPAVDLGQNSNVSVQVANSTAVGGAASRVTDRLKAEGYVTFSPTNDSSGATAVTKIHHVDGYLLEAQALARTLGLDPEATVFPMPANPAGSVAEYSDPNVLVILGADLAG